MALLQPPRKSPNLADQTQHYVLPSTCHDTVSSYG